MTKVSGSLTPRSEPHLLWARGITDAYFFRPWTKMAPWMGFGAGHEHLGIHTGPILSLSQKAGRPPIDYCSWALFGPCWMRLPNSDYMTALAPSGRNTWGDPALHCRSPGGAGNSETAPPRTGQTLLPLGAFRSDCFSNSAVSSNPSQARSGMRPMP